MVRTCRAGTGRKEQGELSPAQENLFLTRWLATALKQRRFPRDVTPDIEWLLNQGRLLGVRAKLADKLDYVWRSCSGELTEQNDMFRLTYALETAKDMGWNYRVMSDREWAGRYALVLNPGVNGVYLLRTNLDAAFDDNGQQTNPLTARLTGSVAGVMKLLNRCGWQAEPESGASPAPPVFTDGRTGSARKGGLVADLRQVFFRQTGHFHDSIAVNAVLQHGTGNFKSSFALAFFNTTLFTQLDALLDPAGYPSQYLFARAVVRSS
jgi:hypothetical protein